MATYHRGAGCTGIDRDLNSHIGNTEGIEICPDNDNESTSSSDNTNAFGGLEADGHPKKHFTQQPGQVNCTHKRNT